MNNSNACTTCSNIIMLKKRNPNRNFRCSIHDEPKNIISKHSMVDTNRIFDMNNSFDCAEHYRSQNYGNDRYSIYSIDKIHNYYNMFIECITIKSNETLMKIDEIIEIFKNILENNGNYDDLNNRLFIHKDFFISICLCNIFKSYKNLLKNYNSFDNLKIFCKIIDIQNVYCAILNNNITSFIDIGLLYENYNKYCVNQPFLQENFSDIYDNIFNSIFYDKIDVNMEPINKYLEDRINKRSIENTPKCFNKPKYINPFLKEYEELNQKINKSLTSCISNIIKETYEKINNCDKNHDILTNDCDLINNDTNNQSNTDLSCKLSLLNNIHLGISGSIAFNSFRFIIFYFEIQRRFRSSVN